jgi:hypothetical protein
VIQEFFPLPEVSGQYMAQAVGCPAKHFYCFGLFRESIECLFRILNRNKWNRKKLKQAKMKTNKAKKTNQNETKKNK